MKHILFFAVGTAMILGSMSCQNPIKENNEVEETIESVQQQVESDIPMIDSIDTTTIRESTHSELLNSGNEQPDVAIREGNHYLSLQWISWDELGEVEIKFLGDNRYSVRGQQKSKTNGDYLKIEGVLTPISEIELSFEGIVEQKISHLNQGQPCVKKGRRLFKSTKGRKYWRMQDMENCEGSGVVDYVDIYF
jgi:hypothetical protein